MKQGISTQSKYSSPDDTGRGIHGGTACDFRRTASPWVPKNGAIQLEMVGIALQSSPTPAIVKNRTVIEYKLCAGGEDHRSRLLVPGNHTIRNSPVSCRPNRHNVRLSDAVVSRDDKTVQYALA